MVELVLGEQRQRQLDDAEPGAEVAAGAGDRVDDEGAHLGGQGAQAVVVHVLDVVRRAERVEQRVAGIGVRRHRGSLMASLPYLAGFGAQGCVRGNGTLARPVAG